MPVVDRLARAESCVHVYQFGYSCDVLSISMCTMTLYQNLKRCTTRNLFEHAACCAAADLWKRLITFAAETCTACVLMSLQRLQELKFTSNMLSGRFNTQQTLQAMYMIRLAQWLCYL